ncbi:MAG: ferritin-like domain-containing protein [Pseudonocardiaceae bacterium]
MSTRITTVERLHEYLRAAMQLEHATIPPYLTALYSIRPGTNSDACHIMRVVAVEEMLHLTLGANMLNAVGGSPDLTAPGFVPDYPAFLPDGETDFQVSRRRFSLECVQNFLQIERPRKAPDEQSRLVHRSAPKAQRLAVVPGEPSMQYYSIGEFYAEIGRGFRYLHKEMGDALFSGDPARQVSQEYFYSGGGALVTVTDLASAEAAIRLISEQGEGFGGQIYDHQRELAHYYRFEQLMLGKYYLAGDEPGQPTGPALSVDWDSSYPIKQDARLVDYPAGSELSAAAIAFNRAYAEFLGLVTKAFTGRPDLLIEAVTVMFRLRDLMTQLMHNPIPGLDGVNAAPTFEMAAVAPQMATVSP